MVGRTVLCPPTLMPLRKTTSAMGVSSATGRARCSSATRAYSIYISFYTGGLIPKSSIHECRWDWGDIMSIYRRSAVWLLGSLALALPQPGLASHVQIFERSSELNIGLDPVDGSRALYDALDVAVEHTPPYCPPEDACQPGYDTKTVSRGQILFYCQVYTDPPMQGYSVCALRGNYGPESISFDLSGDAAATTAPALEVVANP